MENQQGASVTGKQFPWKTDAMLTLTDKKDDQHKNQGQYTSGVIWSFKSWQFGIRDASWL